MDSWFSELMQSTFLYVFCCYMLGQLNIIKDIHLTVLLLMSNITRLERFTKNKGMHR